MDKECFKLKNSQQRNAIRFASTKLAAVTSVYSSNTLESVSIDNEYDYENEILPLTIMRMRFAQNTCSTRSGNSFHDEISSKTRSARNEFLKGKVYLL